VGLIEQAVKIYATAALLTKFLPKGAEYACSAIVLGGALAEVVSCGFSFTLYLFDSRRLSKGNITSKTARRLTRRLFGIAMPVALSTYVRSGLTTLEHILIPAGLIAFGATRSEALAEYGIVSAMVLPLVMFPYAFINSFTGLLVPEIAGAASLSHKKRISYIALRSWRLTIIFGLAPAGIMAVCSSAFGIRLYGNPRAAEYILAIAPLLPIMYLDTVTDSMLKGLGDQVFTMNVNIIDAALSVLLVYILIPRFGTYGYIAVLYISELINFSLSAARLISKANLEFKPFRWGILPLVCLVVSSRICCFLFQFIPLYSLPVWLAITLEGASVVAIFVFLSVISKSIDKELIAWIKDAFLPQKEKRVG
jgi:stage V sporulation protein B